MKVMHAAARPHLADPGSKRLHLLLDRARRHLGMDLVFLAEFVAQREIYRVVAGDEASFTLSQGASRPLGDTCCHAIAQGALPQVVADTTCHPLAQNLPIAACALIGRFIGAPVHLPNGRLYGALCGLGHHPDLAMDSRDSRLLEFVADLIGNELGQEEEVGAQQRSLTAKITPLLDGSGDLAMVFQPVLDLSCGTTVGFEALARFGLKPVQGPDAWFGDAAQVGLGIELELAAISAALRVLDRLPADIYLSINASPQAACSKELAATLDGVDYSRIVLEITEHIAVANYDALMVALAPLRALGLRVAVDDAGAGVASLRHVLELAPDIIKMDLSLTRGIDASPARAALATASVGFSAATGADLLAEGIETPAELATLRRLGVGYGQGYLLGRPGPLPSLPLRTLHPAWPQLHRALA